MRSKAIVIRVLAVMLLSSAVFALPIAAAENEKETEVRSSWKYNFPTDAAKVSITLDGKRILDGEAAILNSVTYVPLRTFSELCGADSVSWNASTHIATVKKSNTTIKVSDRLNYIEASGRYFYFDTSVRNIDDRLFVPIRPLSAALSVKVGWDPYTRTVVLTSTNKELVSGAAFYNSNDLYWLSRIINAEAGGEPLLGKIAVGNVVLNRKASPSYPNTIYGVIFDRKHGTQFTPAVTGTIYKTPSAESIIAAKICLEGYSLDKDVLFFMNPRIATNNWISKNRPFAFRIANHNFYY